MGSPLMTLIFSESPVSLIQLMSDTMENTKNGSEAASDEKFDTLELRNRTVTETLSLVEDFGTEAKPDDKTEKNGDAENGKDENGDKDEKYDKLELRNRTVTETMSLVKDFGKNQESEDKEEKPEAKKQKFDTLSLRNRDVTETLSPLDN